MSTATLSNARLAQLHEAKVVRRFYWRAFAVRFAAGMAAWILLRYSDLVLVADAKRYDEIAGSIAHDWLSGRTSSWLAAHGNEPYQPVTMVTMLACFYVLTLGVRALPLLIGLYCAITSFTPGWIYWIGKEIGLTGRAAMFGAGVAAFCPAFVIWSAALYKEGLILLILSVACYHGLRFQATRNSQSLAIVALCMVSLIGLRIYLAPLLGLAFLMGLALRRTSQRSPFGVAAMAKQTLIIFSFVALMMFGAMATSLSQDQFATTRFGDWEQKTRSAFPTTIEGVVEKVSSSRQDLATAPSGYFPEVRFRSVGDMVEFLPIGASAFLTLPLPWTLGSFRQNIAIPDTALWVFVFYPLAAIGIWRLSRRDLPATLMFLTLAIALCCLYGLFIGNIGTAYRMRVQVWLFLLPFLGIGWEIVNGRQPFVPVRRPRARSPRARYQFAPEPVAAQTPLRDRVA